MGQPLSDESAPPGSFFSAGFSDDHPRLSTDIRPYNEAAVWYLCLVDVSDHPTEVKIEWAPKTPLFPR